MFYFEACLQVTFSVFQGEVGPPGKPGFEGGLGPLGSIGPRGMTMQGKVVGNLLSFKYIPVCSGSNHGTYLAKLFSKDLQV